MSLAVNSNAATRVNQQDAYEIESLVTAYFTRVDRPGSHAVSELFAGAADLILGTAHLRGRIAIAEFLSKRESGNSEMQRTVRHFSSGLELSQLSEIRVRGRSTALVFAAAGEAPLSSGPPSTICDFDDIYVKQGDTWFFERRHAIVLFVGPSAATFAK